MSHFIKIGADGAQLPADAKEHVAVLDTRTGLMWTAREISDEGLPWRDAKKACEALSLAGFQDWRLPEVEELFAIADRSKWGPAIDTEFFPGVGSRWYWSATVDAEAPSSYACFVCLLYGHAYISLQGGCGRVLACRAVSQ